MFKGRWKNKDGEVIDVAIKKFKEDSNDIETEVNILVKLSHPGIVKLHGFCRTVENINVFCLIIVKFSSQFCNLRIEYS